MAREVFLVNTHHVKSVPGRKSDVLDCQWLRQLHSYGLLSGSFRPAEQICVLRSYIRVSGYPDRQCCTTHPADAESVDPDESASASSAK